MYPVLATALEDWMTVQAIRRNAAALERERLVRVFLI
jgi:hypothetical protein